GRVGRRQQWNDRLELLLGRRRRLRAGLALLRHRYLRFAGVRHDQLARDNAAQEQHEAAEKDCADDLVELERIHPASPYGALPVFDGRRIERPTRPLSYRAALLVGTPIPLGLSGRRGQTPCPVTRSCPCPPERPASRSSSSRPAWPPPGCRTSRWPISMANR